MTSSVAFLIVTFVRVPSCFPPQIFTRVDGCTPLAPASAIIPWCINVSSVLRSNPPRPVMSRCPVITMPLPLGSTHIRSACTVPECNVMGRGFQPAGGVRICGIGVAGADALGAGDGDGEAIGCELAPDAGEGEAAVATSAIGTRDTVNPICESNAGTPCGPTKCPAPTQTNDVPGCFSRSARTFAQALLRLVNIAA